MIILNSNNQLTAEKELELINNYTRSEFTSDEVYTFSVTLCDNEVDRDFERFSLESLKKLQELFLGKTGIFDHSMSSKDQNARIFHTFVEIDPVKKNSIGENYASLKARAYMVRNEKNASLIKEIEAGIKKEVSVGCSMKSCVCSVCGKDMKMHLCEHVKGKIYGGKLCYGTLENAADAYEWSFVAVPAQRNAGVTKSFIKKEDMNLNTMSETIKAMTGGVMLSDDEVSEIKSYVSQLEQLASDALYYRKHLIDEIERYSLIVMPKVDVKSFISGCEGMETQKLKKLKTGLEKQSMETIPLATQLKTSKTSPVKDNTQYKI